MSRTITPRELQELLETQRPPLVLDVRRSADFDQDRSMLPGAERRTPEEVGQWAPELPRDREIVIYCVRGGSVSNSVLDSLLSQGLPARFIEGGLEAWRANEGATEGR